MSRHSGGTEPRRHRGRRVLGTLVGLVLVGLVVVAGLTLLLGGAASSGGIVGALPGYTPPPPLLPGAPTVQVPPREPPVTVVGVGHDVSYPQCRSALPTHAAFGIVGVNGGAPLTSNHCLARQAAWARGLGGHAVYINTSWPGVGDPVAYGRAVVDDAIAREHASGVRGVTMWWLDVETENTWNGTAQENATVLAAMASRLQEAGVRVGIYSSPVMWAEIAGDWAPGLPVWNATGPGTRAAALDNCSESFAGSTSAIVQWVQKAEGRLLDHNELCPAWRDRAGDVLDVSSR